MAGTKNNFLYYLVAILTVILAQIACVAPDTTDYVTQPPTRVDVAGTYVFQSSDLNGRKGIVIDEEKLRLAKIDLSPEGRYVATNFPVWEADNGGCVYFKVVDFVSATGSWRIDSPGSAGKNPYYGLFFTGLPGQFYQAPLTNDETGSPSFIFFDYCNDPDSGDVMVFKKMK